MLNALESCEDAADADSGEIDPRILLEGMDWGAECNVGKLKVSRFNLTRACEN